jgi:hypothetical protein
MKLFLSILLLSGLCLNACAQNMNPPEIVLHDSEHAVIKEMMYRSQKHYLVDYRHKCCDRGAAVYDIKGTVVCHYIGIAGRWDDCPNFDNESSLVRIISLPKDFVERSDVASEPASAASSAASEPQK